MTRSTEDHCLGKQIGNEERRRVGGCLGSTIPTGSFGLARERWQFTTPMKLTCSPQQRGVTADEFRSGHSPFSFELHFGKSECALAGGNNQFFVAAQDLSRLAAQFDN